VHAVKDPLAPEQIDQGQIARLVDDLLSAEGRLLALHTPEQEAVVREFGRVARFDGQAIYKFEPTVGLRSLKDSDFVVPSTKRLNEAIRFIQQSMHYGVYVFTDYDDLLKQGFLVLIRQLVRSRHGSGKKLVLVGSNLRIPTVLADITSQFTHRQVIATRPRLRDGKWVY
jgi:hypothetical protein